ncbi:hypothetical protein AB0N87_35790 [Streptomyces sp. NPDC093228]|uniref:hypothetical protein n=1 Tax=Streptomyces sp. NPDC093228 TaxID=3155070 RepID=UPI003437831E
MDHYRAVAPDGLTRRARYLIHMHGLRLQPSVEVEESRGRWLELGIPESTIDRVAAFGQRWGGLALPPTPMYDGGPRYFCPDTPEGSESEGWTFEAGPQRSAVPFSFMIGPEGEFGIQMDRFVPLHRSVEGWVESVALARHAATWAKQITKLTGDEVEGLALDGFEPVPEVSGVADTWWRGTDSLVAIYRGAAECLHFPKARTALVYSGLDDWGLNGG